MSLLTAYLSTPRAQRALTKKPGDKGFSLIELVVVVAVLAILSAIAIPNFTNISANAAHSAAKTTLATVAKECATKFAANETSAQYAVISGGNGVFYNSTEVSSTARACGTSGVPNIICAYVTAGTAASYCVGTDGTKALGALTGIANTAGSPVSLRTTTTGASWLGGAVDADVTAPADAVSW
jgi:prepilin-type N-terminal cleavage/methylation domain-containing protein